MPRNPALVEDFSVNLTRAREIDGWMDEFELVWLGEQARTHSRIVEVGSYKGRTTRILGENTPGVVYAFDDWKGPREDLYQNGERINPDFGSLFRQFMLNCSDLILSFKVKPLVGNHADCSVIPPEWLRGRNEEKPDMVFIDGSHDYDNVKRDILMWRNRIAPGGLLCGHDASWDGVFRAVNEEYPQAEYPVFTDIWSVNA